MRSFNLLIKKKKKVWVEKLETDIRINDDRHEACLPVKSWKHETLYSESLVQKVAPGDEIWRKLLELLGFTFSINKGKTRSW